MPYSIYKTYIAKKFPLGEKWIQLRAWSRSPTLIVKKTIPPAKNRSKFKVKI